MHAMEGRNQVYESKSMLNKIQVRDIALAMLCGIAIYLLRAKEQYILKPVWRHDMNMDKMTRERPSSTVLPVVTDLEGDGEMEVVAIANDDELVVLTSPKETKTKQTEILPHAKVKHSTSLPRFEGNGNIKPVAMNMGFLVPYSKTRARSQVIVIVFSNWNVMCYSHDLKLLWQQTLSSLAGLGQQPEVQAFAVMIIPTEFSKQSGGTVIVGGSFEHESHYIQRVVDKEYRGHRAAASAASAHYTGNEDDKLKHFSTIALSGYNGTVLWHHLPGDFENKLTKEENEIFHWKLQLRPQKLHVKEGPSSKYQTDILKALPHRWHDISDTRFELANIKSSDKSHLSKEDHKDVNTLSNLISLTDIHVIGKAYGGMKPHSRQEHVKNPNAILVYHHKGIEILSLSSGHPLTHLNMQMTHSTYGDINGDGHLDQVETQFNNDCKGIASTLEGSPRALFQVPLCHSPSWLGGFSVSSAMFPDHEVTEDTHVAIPPLLVPSVAAHGSFLRHLQGHTLAEYKKAKDSIFITSNGRITSYGPQGQFNWQTKVSASWAEITSQIQYGWQRREHEVEVFENSFKPSMMPMSLRLYGETRTVLVSGWSTMVLVNLKDGLVLAEHSLPCQPSTTPVLADFNSDEYTDVVVSCSFGYVGFTVESKTNLWYTGLMSAAMVLSLVILHWTCMAAGQPDEEERIEEVEDGW